MVFGLVSAASAKDMTGRFGLGYFNSDAPVGMRYWFSPKVGIDLGVGFESRDLGANNATSYWIEGGIPYTIYSADNANLYLRASGTLGILDDRVYGSGTLDKTWTTVRVTIGPAAEVFFGDHFSLQAAHGIAIDFVSPPDPAESLTSVSTLAGGVSELGFHFYF